MVRSDPRFIRLALVAGLVGLMAACGTPAGYQSVVNQWVGQPIEALTADWGSPTEQMTFDDGTGYVAYRGTQIPGGQVTLFPIDTAERTCWTRFLVDNQNRISAVRFRGNACRR